MTRRRLAAEERPRIEEQRGAQFLASVEAAVSAAVVGAEQPLRLMATALLAGGHALVEDVPGVGKTLLARAFAERAGADLRARPGHARPAARPTSPAPASSTERRVPVHRRARSSPTCCWWTRSTAPRRAPSRRCWRRCRSARSASRARPGRCRTRSWCSPPRTRSSWRAPSRCPRRSSTASCCASRWATPTRTPSGASPAATRRRPSRSTTVPTVDPARGGAGAARRGPDRPRLRATSRRYAVELVRATREHADVRLGGSPRSSVALYRVAQAWALLDGRDFVLPDDVRGGRATPCWPTGSCWTSTGSCAGRR